MYTVPKKWGLERKVLLGGGVVIGGGEEREV